MVGVALGLVFGISHLLGGSPDPSGNPSARPAAASAGSPSAGATMNAGPTSAVTPLADGKRDKKAKVSKTPTPLAVPTGPCADSDVQVTPSVDGAAVAGQDVTITLNLTTADSPACTWQVSPASVVLKVTSGSDRIWSTQDCRAAVKPQSVVVRKDHVSKVGVTWSGQRSDDDCSRTTTWAQPGYYHAEAAALGAEPHDEQFRLAAPAAPTITASPKAHKKADAKKSDETQG